MSIVDEMLATGQRCAACKYTEQVMRETKGHVEPGVLWMMGACAALVHPDNVRSLVALFCPEHAKAWAFMVKCEQGETS